VVLNTLIGINEIILIHHTGKTLKIKYEGSKRLTMNIDCGLTHKSTDYVREKIKGISAVEAQKIDFDDLGIKE
jgi:hypothetical protein